MIEVTKQFRAEIAHRLPNHPGACRFIHGHSYLFEVTVTAPSLNEDGMIIDFKDLKRDIEEVIGSWDHSLILWEEDPLVLENHIAYFDGVKLIYFPVIPTAENMAEHIAHWLNALPTDYAVKRVRVWETITSFADWSAPCSK